MTTKSILLISLSILLFYSCGHNTSDKQVNESIQNEQYQASLRQQFNDYSKTAEKVEIQNQEVQERLEAEEIERRKNNLIEELQGTWEWSGKLGGERMNATYIINDSYISSYSDGVLLDEGEIRYIDFEEGKIFFGQSSYVDYGNNQN